MAQRFISAAVKVFTFSALDVHQQREPTQAEVSDALQRLAVEMRDTVTARTAGESGWRESSDAQVGMQVMPNGMSWPSGAQQYDMVLRGVVVLERAD